MKIKLSTSLLSLFAIVALNNIAGAQSTGKLVLNQGSKLNVENVVKSNITQEMMGQTMEINIDVTSGQTVEVKEKKANSFVLTTAVTKMKMSGSMMGQDLSYDSEKKGDEKTDIGKSMSAMLNKPKDVELSETATVLNAPKASEKKEEEAKDPVTSMLNNMSGPDDSYGAKAAFLVIPAGIKAGDNWSDSIITDEIKTIRQFSAKSINGDVIEFSITGKQVVVKKTETQGMEVLVNLEGKISGNGTVAGSTGVIKQMANTIESTGTVEVMGQSIPMTSKVTIATTVTAL